MFTEFEKGITFIPIVLATLKSERTAYQGESFAFIEFPQHTIHLLLFSNFFKNTYRIPSYKSPNHDLR